MPPKIVGLSQCPPGAWWITPPDLPAVSARKRKAQADNITTVSIRVIILPVMIVLVPSSLADQRFLNLTTEWEYVF
jgi:hypothetical protein